MADASVETAVALYAAFAAGDRARAEALLAPDFHFTSPRDNHIDRAAWFARCWPGSAEAAGFTVVRTACAGEVVYVTHEVSWRSGGGGRNT